MATIGTVALQLGLVSKEFKNGLDKATAQLKNSVNNFKNILIAAKLGQYLFAGARDYVQDELTVIYSDLSAMAEGFTKDQIDALKPLAEAFEYVGIKTETAAAAMQEFILSGKPTVLKQLGIVLSDNTKEMLRGLDAAERYQWVLDNMPERIGNLSDSISEETKSMLAMQKQFDDLKKSMGQVFLTTISNVINAFGGLKNAMTIALTAFTAYKIAMIVGNVAIGISKTIATLGFPLGWIIGGTMGVAALASIGALIGGAALAGSAINNLPDPNETLAAGSASSSSPSTNTPSTVVVIKDRFGETQKVMSERSGGLSNNVQTSYGANN